MRRRGRDLGRGRGAAAGAGQSGFTLTELMATIAIVGILSAGAMVTLRRPQDAGHGAIRLANAMRECGRLATSRGPVRTDVALALGSAARARLVIHPLTGSAAQEVTVELLEEEDEPSSGASWSPVSRFRFSGAIRVAGYRASSELTADLGPDVSIGSTDVVAQCMPNGSTDAMTFYLDSVGSESERARVVVLPLRGEPVTMDGW
jgi:prepilin-type N-terminal cleavage/methylation domain-containing protein